MLSLWLFATLAVCGPGAGRFDVGGVRAWGGMIVLFITFMVISSLWAPELTVALEKSYDLLFVAWSCVLTVAALHLCGVRATIEGFWGVLFGLGIVLAAFGLVALFSGMHGARLAALGGGPNVYGRNMGLLTLAALRLVFDNRRWVRLPAMVVAPLATLLVLLSGSRGAMLALFAGVIVYVGLRRADRRVFRSILLVGIVGLVALATQVGQFAVLVFQERFILLLLAERYFTNRDILLLDGITAGIQNPVGGLVLQVLLLWGAKVSTRTTCLSKRSRRGEYWVSGCCAYRSSGMCGVGGAAWGSVTQLPLPVSVCYWCPAAYQVTCLTRVACFSSS